MARMGIRSNRWAKQLFRLLLVMLTFGQAATSAESASHEEMAGNVISLETANNLHRIFNQALSDWMLIAHYAGALAYSGRELGLVGARESYNWEITNIAHGGDSNPVLFTLRIVSPAEKDIQSDELCKLDGFDLYIHIEPEKILLGDQVIKRKDLYTRIKNESALAHESHN